MLEQESINSGNGKLDLYKYLMQAFDRTYFRLCPNRIRAYHRPDNYDFSPLTREEYLENPELFYEKPDMIPEFSMTKKSKKGDVEVFDVKFQSPVQTEHTENNNAGIIWEGIATQEVKENIIKADITREQVNHIF